MAKIKTVKLSLEQVVTLTTYILMTTNYRKGEREAWETLSQEKGENGEPAFPNAMSNAKFWAEEEIKLSEIRRILDEAEYDKEDKEL